MGHARRPPPAPSWPAAPFALLLATLALRPSSATDWQRVDGQVLADAVAAWGASNTDATFVLPAGSIVDLRTARFGNSSSRSSGSRPFSNGTLTILGLRSFDSLGPDATSSSVLDAGMRSELVPSTAFASVEVHDFSMVNLCLNAAPMENLPFATTTLLGIFGLTPVVLAVKHVRSIDYIPARDLTFVAYTLMAWNWEAVSERYTRQKNALTGLVQILNFNFTSPHEVHAWSTQPGRPPGDLLFRSMRKPGDPLMAFMLQQGLVMPLRWCGNGSLVPPEIADSPINEQWGPLWLVDSAAGLAAGLVNATALAPAQDAQQLPIPGVMLMASRVELPDGALPTLAVAAPVLLHGTLGEGVPWPVLSLTARTSALLSVAPGSRGQLLASRLTLQVPALPMPTGAPGTAVPSALPLTSLVTAPEPGAPAGLKPRVELFNMTLVVPVLNYLALLTLAADGNASLVSMRQCVDNATLQQAALLWPGIQVVQLGSATWSRLTLSAYRGWGVNASLLTVQPQTPVPVSVTQRCPALSDATNSAPPPGDDGSASASPVGVIVGCTVGGSALLAALGVTAAVLLRRRNEGGCTYRSGGKLADVDVDSEVPSSSSKDAAAAPTPDNTTSTLSARGGSAQPIGAPSSRRRSASAADLILALQSQEQRMLARAGGAAAAATLAAGQGDGQGSPSSLMQAHAQLMGVVCLSEVLGRGSNGIVYAGHWRGLPVAVKTLVFEAWEGDDASAECGPSTAGKARLGFVRAIMETAISASVGHRHVVATYLYDIKRVDDDTTGGTAMHGLQVTGAASLDITRPLAGVGVQTFKIFLIQELCTCPLRMVLHHGALQVNPNKLSAVASLLHQVATGLEYLHGRGIIHGDLTPSNILIKVDDSVPGRLLAKLADFGLSLRLDGQATHVSNMAAGTPFYVAPEVVGCKRTSRASDIFSLGVVAWEMYTGHAPFAQAQGGGLCVNAVFPAFPPDRMPPPDDVIALVRRCLQAEPSHRPTASELAAAYAQHVQPPPP